MTRPVAFILGLSLIAGCTEFIRAEQYEMDPIHVSGTDYRVFMRARGTDPDYSDPRTDPNGTRAVYIVVGPGQVIYCGPTAAPCAERVRRFNAGEVTLREGM